MNESFVEIEDNKNYLVSRNGEIYSLLSNKIIKSIILHINSSKVVLIKYDDKYKFKYVHLLVAKAFVDNPQQKRFVNRKDGDKLNCNSDNLEYMTWSEIQYFSYRRPRNTGGNGRLGTFHSKETKELMSQKKTGSLHPKYKGYYSTPLGHFVSSYEAAEAHNISHSCVQRWAKKGKNEFSFVPV